MISQQPRGCTRTVKRKSALPELSADNSQPREVVRAVSHGNPAHQLGMRPHRSGVARVGGDFAVGPLARAFFLRVRRNAEPLESVRLWQTSDHQRKTSISMGGAIMSCKSRLSAQTAPTSKAIQAC